MSKAENVVNSLLETLEDGKRNGQTPIIVADDPMMGLRNTIASYLTQRFSALQDEKDFGEKIRERLMDKLPEAKFSDLLSLFNSQKNRETEAVSALLEFFKPSQGDKSPLIGDIAKKEDSSPEESIFNESSSDVLQAINKLTQTIATINVEKEED